MWKWVLALGAAASAAYFLVPTLVAKDLIYSGTGTAAAIAIIYGASRQSAGGRRPWYLLAASTACYSVGDSILTWYDAVAQQSPSFPGWSDLFYLLGYPFLFAGVFAVSRLKGGPGNRESWAEAAIATVGAFALSYQFILTPYALNARESALGTFETVVTLMYPVMDLGVLFILVRTMMTSEARSTAYKLVLTAVAFVVVADTAYNVLVLKGSYATGNPVDAGFLFNYIFLGAAALHPSASRPWVALAKKTTVWRRVPMVAAAGVIAPVILLVSTLTGLPVDIPVIAGSSILLFLLIVLRVTWMINRMIGQSNLLEQRGQSLSEALEAQRLLEVHLRHEGMHDSLTGLGNRLLLHDLVEAALTGDRKCRVVMYFCDLDGFKGINDTLGHWVGDKLLLTVGKRLVSLVGERGTVTRLGGDEYAVLVTGGADTESATVLAQQIVTVLRQPIALPDIHLNLSVSVGVAIARTDTTVGQLFSEADAAMYEAKSAGKDRFAVFESSMRSRLVDRLALTNSFSESLARNEFVVEYQPHVRLADGRLDGFEALVRWQHPTLGRLVPDRFIQLAEETGFIVPLGRWITTQVCDQAARWKPIGGHAPEVAINVSGRQLLEPRFVLDTASALATSGLAPQRLILEMTETVLMLNPGRTIEVLNEIQAMGVRIAVDDFGTGYSSLSALRRFPVDVLKIDKSFIDPLTDRDSSGATFVGSILRLARDLRLVCTAEGVEEILQLQTLSDMGCETVQGFLIAKPMGAGAVPAYIAKGHDRIRSQIAAGAPGMRGWSVPIDAVEHALQSSAALRVE